jgi:hypothetical protein
MVPSNLPSMARALLATQRHFRTAQMHMYGAIHSFISLLTSAVSQAHTSSDCLSEEQFSSIRKCSTPRGERLSPRIEPKGAPEYKLATLALAREKHTMRAASPPVSFFLRSLFSAMFLRHAKPTRLAVVYLLFTVALVMVPKADIPETLFDEANTPTNEIVVEKAASAWEDQQSAIAPGPTIFMQLRTCVRRILPVYASRLTDSRTLRELICSLLC